MDDDLRYMHTEEEFGELLFALVSRAQRNGLDAERALRSYIASTPAAWGYLDSAFSDELHRVPFEGVPCTNATIASGAYPARRGLNLVTNGPPKGHVARFIRWIRTDRVARRDHATRYIPVDPSST